MPLILAGSEGTEASDDLERAEPSLEARELLKDGCRVGA